MARGVQAGRGEVKTEIAMTAPMRLAVLIDAENISPKLADRIFEKVAPLGTVVVRRLYGDFGGQAASWIPAAERHALQPRHCIPRAEAKNGADITLAVDAMDLLHAGAFEGLCIVSSDSDFGAVVQRVRETGREVFGIGENLATVRYRNACTDFFALHPPAEAKAVEPVEKKTAPIKKVPTHLDVASALPEIRAAVELCDMDAQGWYHLPAFGKMARSKGVAPERFGSATMGKLLTATRQYEVSGHHFRPIGLKAVAGGQ